jgi:hypothetical protein
MRRIRLVGSLLGSLLAVGCYDKPELIGNDTDAGTEETGGDTSVTTTDTNPTTMTSTTMTSTTASTTDSTTETTTASTTASTTDPTEDTSSTDPTDPSDTMEDSSSGDPEPACGDGNADPGEYCPPDAPEIFNVGNGASDVVVADIDDDDNADVVTLNISASTVSVLRGDGAGGFEDPESHTVSDSSCRIQAIDGEGDGDIDLVIAGETMVSLVNDGTGDFVRNDSDVVPFGGCSDHNDLGVLNNNGGPVDVVFSGAYNNTYAPGTNPMSGWTFANDVGIGGVTEGSAGVTVTELASDADNLPDVIVLNQYYNEGEIFRGDGMGGFVDAGTYVGCVGLGYGARFAETGDLDSDGQTDIVTTCMEGNFTIALGNANGTFDAPVEFVYAGAHRALVFDVNRDDYPDLLVTSTDLARINLYLNDGTGTFEEDPLVFDIGGEARSVDVGDFNGDDAVDIVAAYTNMQGGRVAVFFGQP